MYNYLSSIFSRFFLVLLLVLPCGNGAFAASSSSPPLDLSGPLVYQPSNLNCINTKSQCDPKDCICQDIANQCGEMKAGNDEGQAKLYVINSVPPPVVPNSCLQQIKTALNGLNITPGIEGFMVAAINQVIDSVIQQACNNVTGAIHSIQNYTMSEANLVCLPTFGNLPSLNLNLPNIPSCSGVPAVQLNGATPWYSSNTDFNMTLDIWGKKQNGN